MAEIICMESHRKRKAADRGFKAWRHIFQSVTDFDEYTKWEDLPDEVVLFFCEEGPERKHAFYDLLMSVHHQESGYAFESLPYERLSILMNAYFFIGDQARFECMRRLGWVTYVPRADKPIIEVVMSSESYEYAAQLEAPEPTHAHPSYEEDRQSKGIDRAALVRKPILEALRQFKEKVETESTAAP